MKYVIAGNILEILSLILILISIAKNIIIVKPNDERVKIKFNFSPIIRPLAARIWNIDIGFLYLLNPHLSNSLIILFEYNEFNPYIIKEIPEKIIIINAISINYIIP